MHVALGLVLPGCYLRHLKESIGLELPPVFTALHGALNLSARFVELTWIYGFVIWLFVTSSSRTTVKLRSLRLLLWPASFLNQCTHQPL